MAGAASMNTRTTRASLTAPSSRQASRRKRGELVSTPDGPSGAERMTTFAVRLPVAVLDHIREAANQSNVTT